MMIYQVAFDFRPRYRLRKNNVVQILRTCKAINSEAAPILYRDELWKITVTNDNFNQPQFMFNSKPVREDLVAIDNVLKYIQHLRRFDVVVDWESGYSGYYTTLNLSRLRLNLSCVCHFLTKVPSIRVMRLVLNNKVCSFRGHSRQEEELVAESVACILSRLRNVTKLVVDSHYFDKIPDLLQLMKSKMRGSEPVNPLPDMYLALRDFVTYYGENSRYYHLAEDIGLARLCLEKDDMRGFLMHRANIAATIRNRKADEWKREYERGINSYEAPVERSKAELEKYKATFEGCKAELGRYKVYMERKKADMEKDCTEIESKLFQHDPELEKQSDDGVKADGNGNLEA